jgi:hypothetical protein
LPQAANDKRMSRAGLKYQEFSPAPRLSSRNAGRSRPTRCGSKSRRIGDWGAGLARRVEVFFPPTSSATAPPKPRPPGTTNSLDGRHPYQCTIGRYRSWRGFWRGQYDGSNAVIILVSRRRGSRANARGANGWYRNWRRRCGQTHPGTLATDGGRAGSTAI